MCGKVFHVFEATIGFHAEGVCAETEQIELTALFWGAVEGEQGGCVRGEDYSFGDGLEDDAGGEETHVGDFQFEGEGVD